MKVNKTVMRWKRWQNAPIKPFERNETLCSILFWLPIESIIRSILND